MSETIDRPTISEADEQALLDSIDRWLTRKVAPIAAKFEQADEYPAELVQDLCEMGLFGALIEPQYGGLGLPATTYSRIVARISEEWMSLTGFFNSHLMMALIVQKFGTQAQKEHWLPRFATGELRGGLALTEPGAGTDLQGILTTARRDGDVYRINGAKLWITNALEGDILAVLVKTDPDAQPRHAGMSMLITPTRNLETGAEAEGVTRGRKLPKLGYRGIDTGEIGFADAPVDARLGLVGGEEGKGFLMATGGLEIGRVNVAARGVGLAQRALELALRYSQERKAFGKPIAQHQAIQFKLADMATQVDAARLLTHRAARLKDSGERSDIEAGMAKLFASEAGRFCAEECLRIHGGYGYSKEYEIERIYRDAPLLLIGEGTSEIQRMVIGRKLLERHKI